MRHGDPAAEGRDIDDAPHLSLPHGRKDGESGVEGSPKMGPHRILEVVDAHFIERTNLDHACVIDQYVDGSQDVSDGLHGLFDVVPNGNVARYGQNTSAAFPQITFGPSQLVGVARANRNVCALTGKFPR
jgi:hypothetical protein